MPKCDLVRNPTGRMLVFVLVFLLPVGAIAGEPTTQPASDCVHTITYAIPGSDPAASSKAMVVVPARYNESGSATVRWPVVYLLHGYSDNHQRWYERTQSSDRSLDKMADRFGVILVMPDGKYSSWYLDAAPDVPNSVDWQWETVITKYLIPEIDKRYRTIAEPAGRGIAGLSMGGHGAMYLCARHPELFSACGSMSGVMDIRPYKYKYRLVNLLGSYDANPQRWIDHCAVGQVGKFTGRQVGIIIECGLSDRFMDENREMHQKLLDLNIPHDYIERPGGHSWPYWVNALPYHLQFLTDRLNKAGEQVQ